MWCKWDGGGGGSYRWDWPSPSRLLIALIQQPPMSLCSVIIVEVAATFYHTDMQCFFLHTSLMDSGKEHKELLVKESCTHERQRATATPYLNNDNGAEMHVHGCWTNAIKRSGWLGQSHQLDHPLPPLVPGIGICWLYHRLWLLSVRAYTTRSQHTMCLRKRCTGVHPRLLLAT